MLLLCATRRPRSKRQDTQQEPIGAASSHQALKLAIALTALILMIKMQCRARSQDVENAKLETP